MNMFCAMIIGRSFVQWIFEIEQWSKCQHEVHFKRVTRISVFNIFIFQASDENFFKFNLNHVKESNLSMAIYFHC